MRLILGIGNPGTEYEGTRHNCGFLVVDELARRHALGPWTRRWDALVCEWRLPPGPGVDRALLIKPQTYVNLSGGVAQAALAFHKLPPAWLLAVVDDLNLPLGQLRLRADGSAGGHNGLKDIAGRVGPGFPRLRLGIGRPGPEVDQVGYVLGRFAPEERPVAQAMIATAADVITCWLREGTEAASRLCAPPAPTLPAKPPRAAPPMPPSPE
jgi:PTH1 family peptidyl-tRNA hydrolase